MGSEMGILPIAAEDGTKIMSINLLMEDEEAPVIWRGPVIAGTVKQFWSDVVWGDLDYLFVDMPPGTSLPVSSGRWYRDRDISTGTGTDDRKEGL